MKHIFYLMGKSSTGKDTIFGRLMKDEQLNLKNIVGYTTRPMREGEANRREYCFVSEDELDELKSAGQVIEVRGYNTVYGMWYYATVDDEQVELEKDNYLLIGTLESYVKVRDFYREKYKISDVVVPIFVDVEDGERLTRALNREKQQKEPKYAELCRRFLADCEDFSEEKIKAAGINKRFENTDLDQCVKDIKEYLLFIAEKQ